MKGTPTRLMRWLGAMVAVGPLVCGCTPLVWVDAEELIELSASDVDTLSAITHNGRIVVTAAEDDGSPIVVRASKRAGAGSQRQAQACMDALQLTTDKSGGTQNLGWKLTRIKPADWSVTVSFDVTVPPRLAVAAHTHNGSVEVTGIRGQCDLETHNGRITARTESPRLAAESHNGRLEIDTPAPQIELLTHNGAIHASLTAAGDLTGTVTTHNGGIDLQLGEKAATNLACSTHNGSINCSRTMSEVTTKRSRLTGRLGDSDASLMVETHNGSISIK